MIRPIRLELLADPRAPLAGLALLAAGGVILLALVVQFVSLRGELADLGERMQALQTAGRARGAGALVRTGSKDIAADLRKAQSVLRQLAAPWNELFTELERAVAPDVGLLGLQPELAAGRVTIAGEAKNLDAALAFAERVNRGKALSDAFLVSHEIRVQDAQRPVRFTLSARWSSGAVAP
jgi:hypothetical protein